MNVDVNNLGARGLEILKAVGRRDVQTSGGIAIGEKSASAADSGDFAGHGASLIDSVQVNGKQGHQDLAQMIRQARQFATQHGKN